MTNVNDAARQFEEWSSGQEAAQKKIMDAEYSPASRVMCVPNASVAAIHGWFCIQENAVNITELGWALFMHTHYTTVSTNETTEDVYFESAALCDAFSIEWLDSGFQIRLSKPVLAHNLRTGARMAIAYEPAGTVDPRAHLSRDVQWHNERAAKNAAAGAEKRAAGVLESEIPWWERNPRSIALSDTHSRYELLLALRMCIVAITVNFSSEQANLRVFAAINNAARRAHWVKAGFPLADFAKFGKGVSK